MLQRFRSAARATLDRAVRAIAHPAVEAQRARLLDGGLAEEHALNPATHDEAVRFGHMGILSRARERGEAFIARRLQGEAVAIEAAIPGSSGPLCELRIEAQSEPEADGERLRVRAHFRLKLRRAPPPREPLAGRPALPARVGRWIERRLESQVAQILAAPVLDRDINTWFEIRASSAALDEGSRALVPERLGALGITPAAGKPLQTWAGGLPGPRPGFATLTLMQLDKAQLPASVQQALGPQPFQLTATLASSIEEA